MGVARSRPFSRTRALSYLAEIEPPRPARRTRKGCAVARVPEKMAASSPKVVQEASRAIDRSDGSVGPPLVKRTIQGPVIGASAAW
jgi:hypothetical protein